MKLNYKPLTNSTWHDFEQLFGERGACGGCWCMAWRLRNKDFESGKGEGNKKAMRELVKSREQTGIITYVDNEPAAWCSVAPREQFVKLENSRVWKRIDDEPVWSISCLFLAKQFRRRGLSAEVIKCAIEFCRTKGVKIIEAYPVEPYADKIPAAFAWTGMPSSFIKAGFKEVARRSDKKPIMRYYL